MDEKEIQQYKSRIADTEKALKAAEAAREKAEVLLHEREVKLHQQTVAHYCEQMSAQRIAPAIITPIKALLDKLPDSVMLHDDRAPLNEQVQELLDVILQAAATEKLFTPQENAELLPSGQKQSEPVQQYSAKEIREIAEIRAKQNNPNATPYEIARETYNLNAQMQGGPQQ